MKKRIYFLMTLFIATCFAFTGCTDDNGAGQVTAVTVLEAQYVNNIMQLSLKDNATLQLTPYFMPQSAKNVEVTYSNKHPEILDISANGLITPKIFGTDTITIRTANGVSVSYPVFVTDHIVKATAINVTAAGSNMAIKIGKTFDLSACVTLAPADTWDKTVTYRSLDESIATVDANGIVTTVAEGSTEITITTADGSNISRNCYVTVQGIVFKKYDIDRSNWTVSTTTATNYGYTIDGATGKPEDMFDGLQTTWLALTKPGKSYNEVPMQDPDFLPSFTVDMKSVKPFDYIRLQHRNSNNTGFRVWGVNIYGSVDGVNFTLIKADVEIPGYKGTGNESPVVTDFYYINITPSTTYRYVKVELAYWNGRLLPGAGWTAGTGGTNMAIAEFGIGLTVEE
ncbi:MAG: Ig-like domain-containing protein [Candidatus Symbiothrix sp.]|jgi:hypothetical protein|nr:Ig-like domain-containing protein [Candidatus Symbiothrix sp.]